MTYAVLAVNSTARGPAISAYGKFLAEGFGEEVNAWAPG
jgi:hypothetical protein